MRISVIEARDLNEAWFKLLTECLEHGYKYTITHGSHNEGMIRQEIDCAVINIKYPGTRPLSPSVPDGIPAPTTDKYIEEDYLPYLMTNTKKINETYTYGQYIEEQLLECIDMYDSFGFETNQACMTIGDMYSIKLKDPPCLRLIDTRVRYGKLHFFVYFRSWDLWGGLPANLGGIQMMKEMMAKELEVEDGEIFAFSKGLHLYGHSLELAKQVTHFKE